MTTTSITPLRNKDGNGKVYSRLPETEAKLANLCALSDSEIITRCGVEEADASEYIPSECLIYLIREYRSKSLDPRAEAIFTALVRRVLAGLPEAQSVDGARERLLQSNFRDEVRYRFIALLANDRQQYDPKLDIYEIRFQKALATLRICAYRKVRRNENRPTEGIEIDPETGEIAERVEEAAAAAFNPAEKNLLDDLAYRSCLYRAIDALPDLQRAIVMMWLEEIPIESKEPGIVNMSTALGKTPKTIASHRNMAFAALREALMNGATR